jgi:hypothetical protein
MAQNLSKEMTNVTTLQAKQEIKRRCDVTYIIFCCSLGLASQEVNVLTNSTNKIAINLYGYDKMTRPYFSIQTQVKNQQDVILLGLVKNS